MQETDWPNDFVAAINRTVDKATTGLLRDVLSEIDDIGIRFAQVPAFREKPEVLLASIMRNKLLVATLSKDDQIGEVLRELILEMEKSGIFQMEELEFHGRVVEGKLRSL